jgi:hypothetical protein
MKDQFSVFFPRLAIITITVHLHNLVLAYIPVGDSHKFLGVLQGPCTHI